MLSETAGVATGGEGSVSAGGPDTSRRFHDQQVTIWSFVLDTDEVLVRCPRCDARAKVVTRPGSVPTRSALHSPRRLICAGCGHVIDQAGGMWNVRFGHERVGTVHDPFFQCRLWLQADCCGHVLWAYNLRHLDYLRSYVAADLRERSRCDPETGWHRRMTMAAKLPAWLKSAKNRADVMRGIDRLRASL